MLTLGMKNKEMLSKLEELTYELFIVNIETKECKDLAKYVMTLQILIFLLKNNSWYFCDKCDYKTKHK